MSSKTSVCVFIWTYMNTYQERNNNTEAMMFLKKGNTLPQVVTSWIRFFYQRREILSIIQWYIFDNTENMTYQEDDWLLDKSIMNIVTSKDYNFHEMHWVNHSLGAVKCTLQCQRVRSSRIMLFPLHFPHVLLLAACIFLSLKGLSLQIIIRMLYCLI